MENDCDIVSSSSEHEQDNMMELSAESTEISQRDNNDTRKSWKWDHFQIMAGRVTCKICNKGFSQKTSTSILKKHTTRHTTTTESTDPDASIASNASTSTPRRRNHSCIEKPKTSLRNSDYDNFLKNFVIHGNHSFHIVEKEHFQKLIYVLNVIIPYQVVTN